MPTLNSIFTEIQKLTREEGQRDFMESLIVGSNLSENIIKNKSYELQKNFLKKIIKVIDELSFEINKNDNILVSVKDQKLLHTCFQIITSLGITQNLIPGLGIKLSQKCVSASILPLQDFSEEQKYEILTVCTDFFTRSYKVPLLKKIIITLHLSDYIAALIQLAFAPLKKPGTYRNFIMTKDLYDVLSKDRKKYIETYEYLVVNCFQPILMRDLLVLQSVKEPSPPGFAKRAISKELSRRLLCPGGLLSLIRCFMESYDIDTGFHWEKIHMIAKIVSAKHGSDTEISYLNNICAQLTAILCINNTQYLTTALTCIINLNKIYPNAEPVRQLVKGIFETFDYEYLTSDSHLPGTVIVTCEEIQHKVNIFYALSMTVLDVSNTLLLPNIYALFLLGIKCTKNQEMKLKIKEILVKIFQQLSKSEIIIIMQDLLFGKGNSTGYNIDIEEYDAGLAIKCKSENVPYQKEKALHFYLCLLQSVTENNFIQCVFENALKMIIEIGDQRSNCRTNDFVDDKSLFSETDEQYIIILQFLSEVSTSPKVILSLKANPLPLLNFIEHFIQNTNTNDNNECVNISLVLLNTILTNFDNFQDYEKRLKDLVPILESMPKENPITNVLCKEILSLITSENVMQIETHFKKALADAFDDLLPVRAHGLIALTKLIEDKDIETLSKKHYVFCIFQEQLKDTDSYLYLSAINGIASLGVHCTEDVLQTLCNEYLQTPTDHNRFESKTDQNKSIELRMKIGDVIVKVIKKLGDMAIIHKTILLNTMLCGCRDEEPLLRTSALSNLAEIAFVLHYKMGSIINEVLHCVWCILETDKAIECRRATILVISSLFKGLGKDLLLELKENILPIYRTLKKLYKDDNEDSVLRLHAQIALEELNDIVNQFMFPEIKLEKQILMLDGSGDAFK
ncbi:hypothetical protein ACJJTC_011904 [Scirpophaga incertulas]